ncbi:MAG TPA: response regulator transcription factor [Phycisphaerae bacterium]|nr:response regulator transcription factor [Phycisphaerae bacterium]HRR87056.1 response regulator transcription factor [Phycisphaerae bacterium]
MSQISDAKPLTEKPITVVVVDDHGIVRDGVSGMLSREKDIRVVGMAENADEAISKVVETRPDVVLMDIDMPGVSCFDAVQIIRSRVPNTKVILVTAHEHDEYIEQALRVKANGYLIKTQSMAALADAIRDVANGKIHFSPEVMDRLVVKGGKIELENPPKTRRSMLSPRERELLRILAKGVSLKEAASILGISYKTADKQKASLMAKLDIHNRVELSRFAIREGMIEP